MKQTTRALSPCKNCSSNSTALLDKPRSTSAMTRTPEITRPIHFVTHFHMHDHVHATLTFLCLNLATVA